MPSIGTAFSRPNLKTTMSIKGLARKKSLALTLKRNWKGPKGEELNVRKENTGGGTKGDPDETERTSSAPASESDSEADNITDNPIPKRARTE